MQEVGPIVGQLAVKYMGRGVTRDDLMQSGYEGALIAYRKFDPGRGVKFGTYAYYWIEKYLQRAVNIEGRAIRLPQAVHDTKIMPVERAVKDLEQELGRGPTIDEIAERAGLNVVEVQDILNLSRQIVVNLDSKEIAFMPSPDLSLDELTEDTIQSVAIREALGLLSDRHREVIQLRMGLVDGYNWSLRDIADKINLSRQRVQQLEKDALEALRQHPTARRLLGSWK